MNRTLERMLGLAGSAAVGLAAAVAFASEAQAHTVELTGAAECLDDGWAVTWEAVDQDSRDPDTGVIDAVTAVGGALTGDIVEGASLPSSTGEKLVGLQTLSGDEASATLTVDVRWPNGGTSSVSKTVSRPDGGCGSQTDPSPDVFVGFWNDCFGISLEAANYNPDALARIEFDLEPGGRYGGTPQVGDTFFEWFAVDPEVGLIVEVYLDGRHVDTIEWEEGEDCGWGAVRNTCEGLTFELSAPDDVLSADFTFLVDGAEVATASLDGGGSETVEIPAEGDELVVDYVIDAGDVHLTERAVWTEPDDCGRAPDSESPTPAAQLPVTGAPTTAIVAAGAALMLAAAVLFSVTRRRTADG